MDNRAFGPCLHCVIHFETFMMTVSRRIEASLWHLGGSVTVAALAVALVWGVWYPMPYWYLAGGQDLLVLMLSVDLVLGPVLTAVVASPFKTARHLAMDVALIVVLQLVGLGYGLYNVWQVRPVAMVAEYQMLRVVIAADILEEDWSKMPDGMGRWSVQRPVLMGVRPPRDQEERQQMTLQVLKGKMPGSRPQYWQPYEKSREQVLGWASSVDKLPLNTDAERQRLNAAILATGQPAPHLKALPVLARDKGWVALLSARDASVLGFVQVAGPEAPK